MLLCGRWGWDEADSYSGCTAVDTSASLTIWHKAEQAVAAAGDVARATHQQGRVFMSSRTAFLWCCFPGAPNSSPMPPRPHRGRRKYVLFSFHVPQLREDSIQHNNSIQDDI